MTRPPPETTVLPDGRVLAYDDVGMTAGDVLVYLHGAPDCRLARHPDDTIAADRGLRLVAVDRPGYGRSSIASDPSYAGCADDVGHLLDALGVERCRLLAWSAGGPRALAAAVALGPRCRGVTLYAAVPPLEAARDEAALAAMPRRAEMVAAVLDGLPLAEAVPEIAALLLPVLPMPAAMAVELVRDALGPRARVEVEAVPGLLEVLAASQVEASAIHGRAGVVADVTAELTLGQEQALLTPKCPVRLVHGDADPISGPAIGEWYAERLADAEVEVWPDATHHSLFRRWEDLLA